MPEVRDAGAVADAPQRLAPIGFWSYSRQDDELSDGKLSKLRRLLVAEIQQQYGRDPVQLFQDRTTIPHGAEWEQEIRGSIDQANFFIPIVTPNFIQSEWCSAELLMFLEREQALAERFEGLPRRSRIFPINFIDISGVDAYDPRVLAALEQRQAFDFTGLRYRNLQDDSVHQALGEFATSIRRALQIKVRPARPRAAAAPPPAAGPDPARMAVPEADVARTAAPLIDAATAAPSRSSLADRQRNMWVGLALLGAAGAAGAVYLAASDDDPAGSEIEYAAATPTDSVRPSAPAASPPLASGGQFDRLKEQLKARPATPAGPEQLAAAPNASPPVEQSARAARAPTDRAADREEDSRADQQAEYRAAIARVLAADRSGGAASPDQVYARVRSIDLSGTPSDFRRAYRAHVAAWRDRAAVVRMPPGPERQARTQRIDQRVEATYRNAVAIAARYGAR